MTDAKHTPTPEDTSPIQPPVNSTKGGIVPTDILCAQHGGYWPVHRQGVVIREDGKRDLFAFATCGGGYRHEFGEFVYTIKE